MLNQFSLYFQVSRDYFCEPKSNRIVDGIESKSDGITRVVIRNVEIWIKSIDGFRDQIICVRATAHAGRFIRLWRKEKSAEIFLALLNSKDSLNLNR